MNKFIGLECYDWIGADVTHTPIKNNGQTMLAVGISAVQCVQLFSFFCFVFISALLLFVF